MLTKVGPSENKNCRGSLYTCFPSMGFWPLALSMHPPALHASEIPTSNSFNVIQELLHQHPQEGATPSSLHEGHEGKDSWQGVSRTPFTHILNQEMMLPPSQEACFAFLACWAWQSLSTRTGKYKPIILLVQLSASYISFLNCKTWKGT